MSSTVVLYALPLGRIGRIGRYLGYPVGNLAAGKRRRSPIEHAFD